MLNKKRSNDYDYQWTFYLLVVFALIAFLTFFPVFKSEFLNWDDDTHLYDNSLIRTLDLANLKRIFTTTVNDTYIPLTTLSFAIEYHFWKLNPFFYHLNNLLLHIGVTSLVLLFALNLGFSLRPAILAGVLFLVHPMHVESVVWVTERKDVLYAIFYMLSMLCYLIYLRNESTRWRFFLISLLLCSLSILAKPMALSLPLILFLCDWYKMRKWAHSALTDKIPFFLIVIPVTWMTYSLNARIPWKSLSDAILTWIWTFSFYLRKFIFCWDLTPYYVLPKPVTILNPPYLTAVCILVILLISIYRFRNSRVFLFSVLFYFLSIFFLLRFDDLRDTNIVADRFMYLPSVGFCIFIGYIVDHLLAIDRALKLKWTVVLMFFALLSLKTNLQAGIWKDNITFWNYVISKNNYIPRAHNHRGVALVDKKRYDSAIADFSQAIKLLPNYAKAYCNRGDVYALMGKRDLALQDLTKALEIDPFYARAYSSRGILYSKMNSYDLAIQDFTQALKIDPKSTKDYNNRGITYKLKGDYQHAIEDYSHAISLNPNFYAAYLNRGKLHKVNAKWDLAIEDFAHAIMLNPKQVQPYFERANIYESLNQLDFALADYNRVIAVDPQNSIAYYQKAVTYEKKGDSESATKNFQKAKFLGFNKK